MWYVYALKSEANGELYIGMSENPENRLIQHNSGMTNSTKSFRPYKIIFKKLCASRIEARSQEKYYKSGCGREFLKKLSDPR
ncbi:MAG: GIY-YIG nuclease family protein [Candidatus Berkelbacteria bacterium]